MIDSTYRTIPQREQRAIAGLSMGAGQAMRIGLAQSIAAEEVTEEHWRILQVLSDEQGRSMGDLAEQVLLNHPALTKNIDKLVSRGLVQPQEREQRPAVGELEEGVPLAQADVGLTFGGG